LFRKGLFGFGAGGLNRRLVRGPVVGEVCLRCLHLRHQGINSAAAAANWSRRFLVAVGSASSASRSKNGLRFSGAGGGGTEFKLIISSSDCQLVTRKPRLPCGKVGLSLVKRGPSSGERGVARRYGDFKSRLRLQGRRLARGKFLLALNQIRPVRSLRAAQAFFALAQASFGSANSGQHPHNFNQSSGV
jgi:hypothetical protein